MKIFVYFLFALSVVFSNVAYSASAKVVKKSKPVLVKPAPVKEPRDRSFAPPLKEKKPDPGFKFGVSLSERISMQVERQDDGSRSEYFTHELVPTLKTTNYNFLADFIYYDYFNAPAKSNWDMTAFVAGINHPWDVTDLFTLSPQVLVIAPLFLKNSVDFQGAVAGQLTAALKSKDLDVPNLILKYGLRVMKFSQRNEYKVDGQGNPLLDAAGEKQYNTDWRLRQRFHLGYNFTDKMTGMFYFHFDSNLLFSGDYRNGFYHETSLSYAVNDTLSLSLGTTNGGGIYTGDYQEIDNLKFYSKESSEYFAGLGLSF
jgi:hypothetical protein